MSRIFSIIQYIEMFISTQVPRHFSHVMTIVGPKYLVVHYRRVEVTASV